MANEYQDHSTKTGRVTDATFLIQGLPAATAEQFAGSLHQHPAETLDGVIYTAFADAGLPGRSLLQTPPVGQHADSLFIPEACNEVTVVTVPAQ